METISVESTPSAALMFIVDPSAALKAAERAAASCVARRRHSIILGRLINDEEARRLDRQREDDLRQERRHAPDALGEFPSDDWAAARADGLH